MLAPELDKPYFRTLAEFVRAEYAAAAREEAPPVYPAPENVFRAFDRCLPDDVRVVIVGQDPYHGAGQADGLCFSVAEGVAVPPSLRNIFKEIASDTGTPAPPNGDLGRWAEQGVMLLNASLTVREGAPGSHADRGWQTFTDAVVDAVVRRRTGVVYMLWGAFAQRKGARVPTEGNLVLKAAHPSPLSAHNGFWGCRHFSKANEYLAANGKGTILW